MDTLWSPWRYRYVTRQDRPAGCVFCAMGDPQEREGPDLVARDAESLVLGRGEHVYVVLNRYPYSSGHLMIVPYAHVPDLSGLDAPALTEMILLARVAEQALREAYRPGGLNMGLNLGECAGAGVAAHLHFHVLPRWPGDANFMTTVGETRVIPESLEDSWRKLRPYFENLSLTS